MNTTQVYHTRTWCTGRHLPGDEPRYVSPLLFAFHVTPHIIQLTNRRRPRHECGGRRDLVRPSTQLVSNLCTHTHPTWRNDPGGRDSSAATPRLPHLHTVTITGNHRPVSEAPYIRVGTSEIFRASALNFLAKPETGPGLRKRRYQRKILRKTRKIAGSRRLPHAYPSRALKTATDQHKQAPTPLFHVSIANVPARKPDVEHEKRPTWFCADFGLSTTRRVPDPCGRVASKEIPLRYATRGVYEPSMCIADGCSVGWVVCGCGV